MPHPYRSLNDALRDFGQVHVPSLLSSAQHQYLEAPSRHCFEDLLDVRSLETFLNDHHDHLRFPTLRLAFDGRVLAETQFTDSARGRRDSSRKISVPKINAWIGRGATLIIEGIDTYIPSIRSFAAATRVELLEDVRINCYYSAGRISGFQTHYDTHDIFVLQIAGVKEWKVYGVTVPFPLASQPYFDVPPPSVQPELLKLQPGDLLYLPRGCWHSASSLGEPSLHLAVGIHSLTRVDLVDWVLRRLVDEESLRRNVTEDGSARSLVESVKTVRDSLAAVLCDPDNLAKQFDEYRRMRNEVIGSKFEIQ